jgi:hypothetical protein
VEKSITLGLANPEIDTYKRKKVVTSFSLLNSGSPGTNQLSVAKFFLPDVCLVLGGGGGQRNSLLLGGTLGLPAVLGDSPPVIHECITLLSCNTFAVNYT